MTYLMVFDVYQNIVYNSTLHNNVYLTDNHASYNKMYVRLF